MLTIVTNESAADHSTAPDPRALRALAHPLRWQLIDLIGSEMTATATRCAEVLGESVASCSYHLGILGKYGYIELVPGQAGKEKPWRLASRQQNLDPGDLDSEGALAAEAAAAAFLDHELARIKQRLSRFSLEPEPWRTASLLIGETTWMTAEELHDITDQLKQLCHAQGARRGPRSPAAGSARGPALRRDHRGAADHAIEGQRTDKPEGFTATGGSMPDISDYVRTLAGAEAKTGSASWPAAAALWARVVELNPVVGRHWVTLAEARYELGDFDGALAAYGTAQKVGVWWHRDENEAIFPAEIAYLMATCHVRLRRSRERCAGAAPGAPPRLAGPRPPEERRALGTTARRRGRARDARHHRHDRHDARRGLARRPGVPRR